MIARIEEKRRRTAEGTKREASGGQSPLAFTCPCRTDAVGILPGSTAPPNIPKATMRSLLPTPTRSSLSIFSSSRHHLSHPHSMLLSHHQCHHHSHHHSHQTCRRHPSERTTTIATVTTASTTGAKKDLVFMLVSFQLLACFLLAEQSTIQHEGTLRPSLSVVKSLADFSPLLPFLHPPSYSLPSDCPLLAANYAFLGSLCLLW
jgi:hypothetical protein